MEFRVFGGSSYGREIRMMADKVQDDIPAEDLIWDNDDDRRFYEEPLDLKAIVPAVLLVADKKEEVHT